MTKKVTVEIPKADPGEVVTIPKGTLGNIKTKLEQLDKVIIGIILAVILSSIAIVVALIGLILDQMRFNAAAYKEYSDKNDTIIQLQKTNQELLKTNQQLNEALIKSQKASSAQQ